MLFDYLKGRWSQEDIQKYIKFSTVVRDVVYNKATDDFTVSVKDLKNDEVIDGERYIISYILKIMMLNGQEDPLYIREQGISILGSTMWWWRPATIPLPTCQPSLGSRGSLGG